MSEFRLLAIEDDPKIASLICRVAEGLGFVARSAYGEAMVKAYKDLQPDIIVLDIMMPDMDGIEVLQYLRDQFSRAHIIILSGSDGMSRRIVENMGTSLGFTIVANLSKPFRVPELRILFENTRDKVLDQRRNYAAQQDAS